MRQTTVQLRHQYLIRLQIVHQQVTQHLIQYQHRIQIQVQRVIQ
ncbi:hypothetical protein [Pediococcus pentosaceus]